MENDFGNILAIVIQVIEIKTIQQTTVIFISRIHPTTEAVCIVTKAKVDINTEIESDIGTERAHNRETLAPVKIKFQRAHIELDQVSIAPHQKTQDLFTSRIQTQ